MHPNDALEIIKEMLAQKYPALCGPGSATWVKVQKVTGSEELATCEYIVGVVLNRYEVTFKETATLRFR